MCEQESAQRDDGQGLFLCNLFDVLEGWLSCTGFREAA